MKHLISLLCSVALVVLSFATAVSAQFIEASRVQMPAMSHDEWATQVVSTPSGKEIVSAGADGRVIIWDAASGKPLRDVSFPSIVLSISVSSDGRTIAAGDSSGKVSFVDINSGQVKNSFIADKEVVNASAWSRDGKFVAAGGREGIVRVWSVADGKLAGEVNPAKGTIAAVAFANSQLVVGTLDLQGKKSTVELWDWQNQKVVRTFDEGVPAVRGLSVSADEKLLVIGHFQPASLLFMLFGEGNSVEVSLRTLPESDEPQTAGLWDIASGKRLSGLDAETGARTVAFSPDGRLVATAGANGAMIFDVAGGTYTEVGRVDSATGIDSVAFSPDSQRLIVARERQPMAQYGGEYGFDRLIDPFYTNMVMTVREGAKPTFTRSKTPQSITGGSNIDVWQLKPLTGPIDTQIWDAVKAVSAARKDDARKNLEQIIKENPRNGRAQRLYVVFFEASDVKKASDRLEAAIKADPDCVSCLRSLGDLQATTKQWDKAMTSYGQALKLKPEYGLVAGRLADVYAQVSLSFIMAGNTKKNMESASTVLAQAIALRPAEEQYITNMASIAYFRGEFDTSIDLLQIARQLRPDHARIYYNLGHSYREKGDKKKAVEAYRIYVQLGERGQEARVDKAKQIIADLSR